MLSFHLSKAQSVLSAMLNRPQVTSRPSHISEHMTPDPIEAEAHVTARRRIYYASPSKAKFDLTRARKELGEGAII